MVIFIDFHGLAGSVVLGLIFYGIHKFQMILNGFVWILLIPVGSGVPGLIFNGFHRFLVILGGFVWIPWIPGAPRLGGRFGSVWQDLGTESGPY